MAENKQTTLEKRNKELQQKVNELCRNELDFEEKLGNNNAGFFLLGAMIMLVLIFIILHVYLSGHYRDVIDTEYLGEKLCRINGLEYDHVEILTDPDHLGRGNIPKIYCTTPRVEQSVIDGVVVQTGNIGRVIIKVYEEPQLSGEVQLMRLEVQ